jgi:hypothetical protein
MQYWWMNFDFTEFKVPRPIGKIILMIDMLEPGFVMNPDGMAFKFQMGKSDTRKIGDFAPYMGFTFFASDRTYKIFAPMFEKSGKSWPMHVGKYRYKFVCIEAACDGFDYERSEYVQSEETGIIVEVNSICLKKGFNTSLDIFRLVGEPDITANLIVSDRFRNLYENSSLTGLFFLPLSA